MSGAEIAPLKVTVPDPTLKSAPAVEVQGPFEAPLFQAVPPLGVHVPVPPAPPFDQINVGGGVPGV